MMWGDWVFLSLVFAYGVGAVAETITDLVCDLVYRCRLSAWRRRQR